MYKYKDTYYILRPKDKFGKPTINKDDNYIPCIKNVQFYRYSTNTLAVMFWTNQYAHNRLKELSEAGVIMKPFQIGDNEQVYLFPEYNLSTVADIVKAKKRIKRNYTDEQKEEIRERLKRSLNKNNS